MATIMSTKDLWRRLGGQKPLPGRSVSEVESGALGVWGAKAVFLPEGSFCVALNETTHLTIVFPLAPLPSLLGFFMAALVFELEHLGISGSVIKAEVEREFGEVTFLRHSNRSLLGSLNDVCYHLACALEGEGRGDPDTVLNIQHELNEMPHANREMPFPCDAALLLFSGGGEA